MKTQKNRKKITKSMKVQAITNGVAIKDIEINLVKNSPAIYKANRVSAYAQLVP